MYLEALACGIPVVASTADASREALLDGRLGQLVDPDDADSIVRASCAALRAGRGRVPDELAHFSAERFDQRWQAVLDAEVGRVQVAANRDALVIA